MNEGDFEAGPSTSVSGQLLVSNLDIFLVVDSGPTHSYIAKHLGDKLEGNRRTLSSPFVTVTPAGDVYKSTSWFKDVPIKIGNSILYTNLVEIKMCNFDVILWMDWLNAHYAMIDCYMKRVRFSPPNAKSFEFQGTPHSQIAPTISALRARKLLDSGCQGYLAYIVDKKKDRESVPEDRPIVESTFQSSQMTLQGCHPIERSSFA